MKRLILRKYTGAEARNMKIARRIVRKIYGSRAQRHCLLVDCEGVKVFPEFLELLTAAADPEKIRFCGLPVQQQDFVASHERKGSS